MRPLSLTLLTFSVALLATTASAQDWPNYGGNNARNGRATALGPLSAALAWENDDDFSLISWHPFIEGERVFTVREAGFPQDGGAANDAIVAYDLASGEAPGGQVADHRVVPEHQVPAPLHGQRGSHQVPRVADHEVVLDEEIPSLEVRRAVLAEANEAVPVAALPVQEHVLPYKFLTHPL